MQQFGSDRRESGHRADTVNVSLLTLLRHQQLGIVAPQSGVYLFCHLHAREAGADTPNSVSRPTRASRLGGAAAADRRRRFLFANRGSGRRWRSGDRRERCCGRRRCATYGVIDEGSKNLQHCQRPCVSPNAMQQNDCFSNRPFGVKHFQTVHRCSVDVAHGLVLLFGIGTKALPAWDSKTRNNLLVGLTVRWVVGPSGHANSPHPSSRRTTA